MKVSWNPTWEPEELQSTRESFWRSLRQYEEHITAPNLQQLAPDTHLDDLQKQRFSASNQERNSYQPYDIKLWNRVNFDTNPQADIVATVCYEYWIIDVDIIKHQGNDTESPSDDPTYSRKCTLPQ